MHLLKLGGVKSGKNPCHTSGINDPLLVRDQGGSLTRISPKHLRRKLNARKGGAQGEEGGGAGGRQAF